MVNGGLINKTFRVGGIISIRDLQPDMGLIRTLFDDPKAKAVCAI